MHFDNLGPRSTWTAIVLAVAAGACGLTIAGTGDSASSGVDGGTPPFDASSADALLPTGDAATVEDDPGALHLASAQAEDGVFASLAIPDAFTIEMWIRIEALPADQERYVFAKDQQDFSPYQLRFGVDQNGNVFFVMSDASGDLHGLVGPAYAYTLITTRPIALKAWVHVAATHAGAATSLYIDGALTNTITSPSSWVYGDASPLPAMFGARVGKEGGASRNGNFDGDIDDLRVYRVARTQANIAADRGREVVPGDADYASLVAYLKFDDRMGATASDVAGANEAKLEGAPTWLPSGAF